MTVLARLVLIAGVLTAAALFFSGASSTASEDGYAAAQAWYLMWAGVATIGITLAAQWLVSAAGARPRRREDVRSAVLVLVCTLGMLGVGEAAVYVATTTTHPRGAAVFLAGFALVTLLAAPALGRISRTRSTARYD